MKTIYNKIGNILIAVGSLSLVIGLIIGIFSFKIFMIFVPISIIIASIGTYLNHDNLTKKKQMFEIYYTDLNDENEGKLIFLATDVDEAEDNFKKQFPHLKLYDIGEIKTQP